MGEGERASTGGDCVRAGRSYVGGDMGVQFTAQYRVGASYDAHDILWNHSMHTNRVLLARISRYCTADQV